MGNDLSKVNEHLREGREHEALIPYKSDKKLARALRRNLAKGDRFGNTPLHYTALHGLAPLLRDFLCHRRANANQQNKQGQTTLHLVCTDSSKRLHRLDDRIQCLKILLVWNKARFSKEHLIDTIYNVRDKEGNTSLHSAAASGLLECVQLLVQEGFSMFVQNVHQDTPCDRAEQNGHDEIAAFLESRMVFFSENSSQEQTQQKEILKSFWGIFDKSNHLGLKWGHLKVMEQELLRETAHMLSISESTAELLLRNHDWSKNILSDCWFSDPSFCCTKSGLRPETVVINRTITKRNQSLRNQFYASTQRRKELTCGICMLPYKTGGETLHIDCEHQFCRGCWKSYIHAKITEGESQRIICPANNCDNPVPRDFILKVVSPKMGERFSQLDIQAFVETNPILKWCPYPSCGRAVVLPRARRHTAGTPVIVDCGKQHYFCWECQDEAKDYPCTCGDGWMNDMAQKSKDQQSSELEDLFTMSDRLLEEKRKNRMWLIQNTKDCPHCKVPIEKVDGCDSMRCTRCDCSFTWNDRSIEKDVDKELAKAPEDATEDMQRRWNYTVLYHRAMFQKEQQLLQTCEAIKGRLAAYFDDTATGIKEAEFLEAAIQRLLLARRVLLSTCVYFLIYSGPQSIIRQFQTQQDLLARDTKTLSQMLDKTYLTTMKRDVIRQSNVVQKKSSMVLADIWKYGKPSSAEEIPELSYRVHEKIRSDTTSPVSGRFKPRPKLLPNSRERWKTSDSALSDGELPGTSGFESERYGLSLCHENWNPGSYNVSERVSVSSDSDLLEMNDSIAGALDESYRRNVFSDGDKEQNGIKYYAKPLQHSDLIVENLTQRNVISVLNGCETESIEFTENNDVIFGKESNSQLDFSLGDFNLHYNAGTSERRPVGSYARVTGLKSHGRSFYQIKNDKTTYTPPRYGSEMWFVNPIFSLETIREKGFLQRALYPHQGWRQSSLLNRPHIGKITLPAESSWISNYAYYI